MCSSTDVPIQLKFLFTQLLAYEVTVFHPSYVPEKMPKEVFACAFPACHGIQIFKLERYHAMSISVEHGNKI